MARNLVTRTVHGTQVSLKVVDKATEQIVEDSLILSKSFDAIDDKLKKAVTKALSEDKILVAITAVEKVDKCYGVPVAQFMELAVEIDPKTRTALAAEDTEE
jgi:phosphohistidine swiveling domain-containing protein